MTDQPETERIYIVDALGRRLPDGNVIVDVVLDAEGWHARTVMGEEVPDETHQLRVLIEKGEG